MVKKGDFSNQTASRGYGTLTTGLNADTYDSLHRDLPHPNKDQLKDVEKY